MMFNLYGLKDLKKIIRVKNGINLSQGKPLKFYSSDRIAQLIGNGILTFIDEKTKLKSFFNTSEVVYYKNVKDLSN